MESYEVYNTILYIVIILLFIILYYIDYNSNSNTKPEYNTKPKYNTTKEYIIPYITIKNSPIGGRGVFAKQSYKKGDVIEICPCIRQHHKYSLGKIYDYTFNYNDSNDDLIAFGYGSLYNHTDNPNAEWNILNEHQMEIIAIKDISVDEEIYISYGDNYFNYRSYLVKNS